MNDFVRCNKLTGVHWLKGPVDNLRINIKLKPPDDVISLPKFEDYTNESSNLSLEQQNIEEFSFKWQEKIFSASEVQRYKDVHNCLTENELKYHELITKQDTVPQKVFSYVHEDYYLPLPQERKKISSPCLILERLSLDDAIGRIGEAFGGKTDSEKHLFKSQENVCDEEQQWMTMHVVFDKSEYNEETLLIKQEARLLSLYYNYINNYIIATPDLNNLETNPYAVEVDGQLWGYQYEVSLDFGDAGGGEELVVLLKKLHKKWEKKHKQLVNFTMPPLGKMQYHVTVELAQAKGFEMEDLYIEYDIKLPEGIECREPLHGRTHVSEATSIDDDHIWHYGHLVELCLEVGSGIETQPINFYLEAISTDFWRRHRTEGYSHLPLPLNPGTCSREVRCVRPDEAGAEERRFFVGGCHLLKDLEVLSNPEMQNGDYTYTETGSIHIRYSVVCHRPLPAPAGAAGAGAGAQQEPTSASALLLGAEAALRKYRKARARLAHATTTV